MTQKTMILRLDSRQVIRLIAAAVVAGLVWLCLPTGAGTAHGETGWSGKRHISFQRQNDLFYNYYVGPEPSGTAAEMYTAPLPVPEHVGHTYNTYQPVYPHEFMYGHCRSWWTHTPGAGWTRTKARYVSAGGWLQNFFPKPVGDWNHATPIHYVP